MRTALACVAVLALASVAPAETIFGVTGNELVVFDSATPGTLQRVVAITGLQPGDSVLAIDFRPANGQLYGLGRTSRLYRIHPMTGVATAVGGPFSPPLQLNPPLFGVSFGFDFNPVLDRIRVVSSIGQNFRLNPDTGAVAGTDTPLQYAAGDPHAGTTPTIRALAYSDNVRNGTSTTAYGIDTNLDTLVTVGGAGGIPSPNGGTLFTVGNLGFNADFAGFDIAPGTGRAFAALVALGPDTPLYTINLATGAGTLIGSFPLTLVDIAVAGFQLLVTGAGPGGGPHVEAFDAWSGPPKFSFFAFDATFTGGVRTASCDVNGDGIPDIIVGAGPGGGPHVKVFDGFTGIQLPGSIGSFFAFNPAFTAGVTVGCADLDGDGHGDVIVGAGPGGGPHVVVISGATGGPLSTPLASFFAYPPTFTGGVFVGGGQ